MEGQHLVTSGSLTHEEQDEKLLDGLKGSANLEGFKAEEKIDSKTVLKTQELVQRQKKFLKKE